jgi:peptide/nickel transport system substrate-binding protein
MPLLAIGGLFGPTALAAESSIKVAIDVPPRTMDPAGSLADANMQVMRNIFDPLLTRRGGSGKLLPNLAEKWEQLDLLRWKFYLKKGVKFTNGNSFTAADVKFTMDRLKDPKCCAEYMDQGNMVDNIEIIDDQTLIIKTSKPVAWFDQTLDIVFIMDKESTESRDPGEVGLKPIGTGPYKLVEWVKGSYLKLEANEDYWRGAPSIKLIDYRPVKESATRFAAVVSGKVDFMSGIPVELYDKLVQNPKIEVVRKPGRRTIHLQVTNRPGTPMADIRVRKAMYMAINEDEIIAKIMRGHASPAAQMPDSAANGYNENIKRLPYDPAQAKKLLAEAGYPDGFELTLSGPNDRYINDEKICEAVAKYWAKVGIKAKFDVKPKAVYFPECVKGGLDVALLGWLDNAYDLSFTFGYLAQTRNTEKGTGSWNATNFSDPDIDKGLEETAKILDRPKRTQALQKLNRLAQDEKVNVIPLHYNVNTYALRKAKGIVFTPRPDRWLIFEEFSLK